MAISYRNPVCAACHRCEYEPQLFSKKCTSKKKERKKKERALEHSEKTEQPQRAAATDLSAAWKTILAARSPWNQIAVAGLHDGKKRAIYSLLHHIYDKVRARKVFTAQINHDRNLKPAITGLFGCWSVAGTHGDWWQISECVNFGVEVSNHLMD